MVPLNDDTILQMMRKALTETVRKLTSLYATAFNQKHYSKQVRRRS